MKIRFHLQDSRPQIWVDGSEQKDFLFDESKKLAELEITLDQNPHEIIAKP